MHSFTNVRYWILAAAVGFLASAVGFLLVITCARPHSHIRPYAFRHKFFWHKLFCLAHQCMSNEELMEVSRLDFLSRQQKG